MANDLMALTIKSNQLERYQSPNKIKELGSVRGLAALRIVFFSLAKMESYLGLWIGK